MIKISTAQIPTIVHLPLTEMLQLASLSLKLPNANLLKWSNWPPQDFARSYTDNLNFLLILFSSLQNTSTKGFHWSANKLIELRQILTTRVGHDFNLLTKQPSLLLVHHPKALYCFYLLISSWIQTSSHS